MNHPLSRASLSLCAFAALLAVCHQAQAADPMMTNAAPAASAASAGSVRRTLRFKTSAAVPVTLTVRQGAAPIADGFKPQVRFAGQTASSSCTINMPKADQKVQPGETAVATLKCTKPWQVYDNGLSFEAFDGGRRVAEGTLRP